MQESLTPFPILSAKILLRESVSRSPQRQRAIARVILPLFPSAEQQLFRKRGGGERGSLSINSSAWARMTLSFQNSSCETDILINVSGRWCQQLVFLNSRFPPAVFHLVMSFSSLPKSVVWKRNKVYFIYFNKPPSNPSPPLLKISFQEFIMIRTEIYINSHAPARNFTSHMLWSSCSEY